MGPFLSIQDIRVQLMEMLVAVVALAVVTPGLPLGAVTNKHTHIHNSYTCMSVCVCISPLVTTNIEISLHQYRLKIPQYL